jgi:glycosyltransferase involved in cell wall biosynthesis
MPEEALYRRIDGSPDVSVVIPTYGSAPHLIAVIEAIQRQTYTPAEIIVIDNNPVAKAKQRLADSGFSEAVRVFHDGTPCLSKARNAGLEAARGRFVAFLDDDAVPMKTWLSSLITGICEYGSAVAGGAVQLQVQSSKDYRLVPETRALLSELSYGQEDIPNISDDQYIVGANMCCDRSTLVAVRGFDPNFGRRGQSLLSSEELDICRRLQRKGHRVSYIFRATVLHCINPSRLHLKHLLARAYWQGRSDALLEYYHGRPKSFGYRTGFRNCVQIGRVAGRWMRAPTDLINAVTLARELGFGIGYAVERARSRS